jgi:hypothetical protein
MKQTKLGHCPSIGLKVTKDIIARGTKGNSNHCMVAEAIKEAYPKAMHVAVDIQTIRFSDREKRERYTYLTPKAVQRLIVRFDQGKPIKPFYARTLAGGQVVPITARGKAKTIKPKLRRKSRKANMRTVKEIVGGHQPPRSIGARRQYGLRAFTL